MHSWLLAPERGRKSILADSQRLNHKPGRSTPGWLSAAARPQQSQFFGPGVADTAFPQAHAFHFKQIPMGGQDIGSDEIQADEMLLAGETYFNFSIAGVAWSAVLHGFFEVGQGCAAELAQLDERRFSLRGYFFQVFVYGFGCALHGGLVSRPFTGRMRDFNNRDEQDVKDEVN